jgi:hypothetical protein
MVLGGSSNTISSAVAVLKRLRLSVLQQKIAGVEKI